MHRLQRPRGVHVLKRAGEKRAGTQYSRDIPMVYDSPTVELWMKYVSRVNRRHSGTNSYLWILEIIHLQHISLWSSFRRGRTGFRLIFLQVLLIGAGSSMHPKMQFMEVMTTKTRWNLNDGLRIFEVKPHLIVVIKFLRVGWGLFSTGKRMSQEKRRVNTT